MFLPRPSDIRKRKAYLRLNDGAVLDDLLEHIVVLAGAELTLQLTLGGTVEDAVVAVPVQEGDVSY